MPPDSLDNRRVPGRSTETLACTECQNSMFFIPQTLSPLQHHYYRLVTPAITRLAIPLIQLLYLYFFYQCDTEFWAPTDTADASWARIMSRQRDMIKGLSLSFCRPIQRPVPYRDLPPRTLSMICFVIICESPCVSYFLQPLIFLFLFVM